MPNPLGRSAAWLYHRVVCGLTAGLVCLLTVAHLPLPSHADPGTPALTLERIVALAVEANLSARIAAQQTRAAEAVVKSKRTEFMPTVSTRYGYIRYDEPLFSLDPGVGVIQPEEQYQWVTSVTQPLFTGFALTNQFKLARMGLDVARHNEALVRRDVVFEAKQAYFLFLRAQTLKAVAEEAVAMLEAQTAVATNFHEVGMTPLNDLLKTKVELANARQDLVAAQNQLENARTNVNILLRRPIATPVTMVDLLDPPRLGLTLAQSVAVAEKGRLEVAVADLEIQIREKEVALARQDYYPTVQVQGNYYKQGTDWQVDGGRGISDSSYWDVQAQATWDVWRWGRTGHGVAEKKSNLAQARLLREELMDRIRQQVKRAWLKADESEKNIVTVQSAIDQAREGFRISEAMYKEQMATATDVLDARTQLSETRTRYFNALYDFQIALAALERAMGKPNAEIAEDP